MAQGQAKAQNAGYDSLVRIADEIKEIKQLVSAKKEPPPREEKTPSETEDFAPMQKVETE